MGNPAGDKKKKKERRRKKFEDRLGPAAYLPKDIRDAIDAELAKADQPAKAAK